ncbi:MAG: hypothetical protein MJB12_14845 [Firmicutes bacterium]|nr:hypothetical protein [Bacillota bacterium]
MNPENLETLKLQIRCIKQKLVNMYRNQTLLDENVLKLAYQLKILNEKYEQRTSCTNRSHK